MTTTMWSTLGRVSVPAGSLGCGSDPGGRMGFGLDAAAGSLSPCHPSRLRAMAPPRAAVRPRNERRDGRLSGTAGVSPAGEEKSPPPPRENSHPGGGVFESETPAPKRTLPLGFSLPTPPAG